MPGVDVHTELPSLPYVDPVPAIILSEYRQIVCRIFTGLRGNPDKIPNLYSFVYLQAPAKQQPGRTTGDVVKALRKDLDRLIDAFGVRANGDLNGAVMRAGDTIEVHYDRWGPYLNFFGTNYVGAFGLIDVQELYRPDTE